MTEEHSDKLDELHDFFFREQVIGQPPRAEQIDQILIAVRTGRNTIRFLLWALGGVTALAVSWSQIKDFLK